MQKYEAAIFDLDGVLVDTAQYHYLAWKRLSETLSIEFSEEDNERLKGVNRMKCLDIILELGGISLSQVVKQQMADKKNNWYKEYIESMDRSGLLEGGEHYLQKLKSMGIKIAVGSASKNAGSILTKTGIYDVFDSIVDGNHVSNAKPDPEVFIKCAEQLGVLPRKCIVFEDSQAGIMAAKSIGMATVGIGSKANLKEADIVIKGLIEAETAYFQEGLR